MSTHIREGETLANKYRIERVLGEGGMGVVVVATHLQLEQYVAIKFLKSAVRDNQEAVTRFLREAKSAAKIQGEHVARVLDVSTLEDGTPYIVMEYLEGSDLEHVLQTRTTLPIQEAVDYLLQAMEAIAEAHNAGIVHRDLKPSNLFLTQRADGSSFVKVLDFGISKVANANNTQSDASMTKTTAVMGSPLYMSPEQMRSTRNVDSRTDIWALGVILYELLAGRSAFWAETMPQLCAMILVEAPPSLIALRADVPLELEQIIFKCLEKQPEHRFDTIADLAIALGSFGSLRSQISVERITRIMSSMSHSKFGASSKTGLPEITTSPSNASSAASVAAVSIKPIHANSTRQTWNFTQKQESSRFKKPFWIAFGILSFASITTILFFSFRNSSRLPSVSSNFSTSQSGANSTSLEPVSATNSSTSNVAEVTSAMPTESSFDANVALENIQEPSIQPLAPSVLSAPSIGPKNQNTIKPMAAPSIPPAESSKPIAPTPAKSSPEVSDFGGRK